MVKAVGAVTVVVAYTDKKHPWKEVFFFIWHVRFDPLILQVNPLPMPKKQLGVDLLTLVAAQPPADSNSKASKRGAFRGRTFFIFIVLG